MIFTGEHLLKARDLGIVSSDDCNACMTSDNIFAAVLSAKSTSHADLVDFISENASRIKRYQPSVIVVDNLTQSFSSLTKMFCMKYQFVPISKHDRRNVDIAIVDPFNQYVIDDICFALDTASARVFICTESELTDVISMTFDASCSSFSFDIPEDDKEEKANIINLDQEMEEANSSSIVNMINSIISKAINSSASDIHVEAGDSASRVRVRIDGDLQLLFNFPSSVHHTCMSRIKIMSGLDISNSRTPQDGRINLIIGGRNIDMRVSVLPTARGEKCVMRILDKSGLSVGLNAIGLSRRDMIVAMGAICKKEGACLVTGPTGSGKTTTLYSFLNSVNDDIKNIITVEDPVEFMLEGINQVSVNVRSGLTFAGALRSILRQDPDIIMLGEIRDNETAGIALEAAQTGHMVMSTLHTNDAAAVITRLHELGIDRTLISSSLNAIIAQRLIKRLCKNCTVKGNPTKLQTELLGIPPDYVVMIPVGCSKCNKGYKGRLGIHEVIRISEAMADLINDEKCTHAALTRLARSEGMLTIFENGLSQVLGGVTSLDELMGTATPSDDFKFFSRVQDNVVMPLQSL